MPIKARTVAALSLNPSTAPKRAPPAGEATAAARAPDVFVARQLVQRAAGVGATDPTYGGKLTPVASNNSGAYFFKIALPPVKGATGIALAGTLPVVKFDPNRLTVAGLPPQVIAGARPATRPAEFYGALYAWGAGNSSNATALLNGLKNPSSGPLDRPSVYTGGRCGKTEVDAGLCTALVLDPSGNPTFTVNPAMNGGPPGSAGVYSMGGDAPNRQLMNSAGEVVATGDQAVAGALGELKLCPNYGFRPYYRVSPGIPWANPPVRDGTNTYFFGGDNFTMKVAVAGPGAVALTVASGSNRYESPAFAAPDFGTGKDVVFKRINSIDQRREVVDEAGRLTTAGIEGKQVAGAKPDPDVAQPTTATATGAAWTQTSIVAPQIPANQSVWASGIPVSNPRGAEFPLTPVGLRAFAAVFGVKLNGTVETIDIDPPDK